MARRFLKRFVPAPSRVHEDRLVRRFGRLLQSPRIWHLNRRTVSRAAGCGLFWAFIPIPGQTLLAALSALWTRGNVPVAMALTWLSNPLTTLPWFYVGYRLGLILTGQPPLPNFLPDLLSAFSGTEGGVWASAKFAARYVIDNLGILLPFLVGCFAMSVVAGVLGYFGVRGVWTLSVRRRWNARGHLVRCIRCGGTMVLDQPTCADCNTAIGTRSRIGLGLASVARLAGREPDGRPTVTPPTAGSQ